MAARIDSRTTQLEVRLEGAPRFSMKLRNEEHQAYERAARDAEHPSIAAWLRALGKADARKMDRELGHQRDPDEDEHALFERVSRERGQSGIAAWLRMLANAAIRKLEREDDRA